MILALSGSCEFSLFICLLAGLLSIPTTSSLPYTQSSYSHKITKRQAANNDCVFRCPFPTNVSDNNPCGTCDHSECKFEGCVYYSFFTYWKPERCTTCFCNGGRKRCYAESCQQPECYGYPARRRPGECCEECDYGIPKNECGLIPNSVSWVSYRSDYLKTCHKVVKHKCYRPYVFNEEKWYKCEAKEGWTTVSTNEGCGHLVSQYHKDKVSCNKVLITDDRALPQDYAPDLECHQIPPE